MKEKDRKRKLLYLGFVAGGMEKNMEAITFLRIKVPHEL